MKRILLGALVCMMAARGQAQDPARNYLTAALEKTGFRLDESRLNDWKRKEKASKLAAITKLPDSIKQRLVGYADQALSYEWPLLPAMSYLEFRQNGNRVHFERKATERRLQLTRLVIGELIRRDGKYLSQIVNGLWATLEESTWEIPAIINLQKAGADLPDPDETIIGLVNAETGLTVATIDLMLHDELNKVSGIITKRIHRELESRIIQPYLQRDDLWWMGLKGQSVNNWNAWINSNVLQIGMLAGADAVEVNKVFSKVFQSADHFINQYPADGGCDEGPSYWSLAGGKLIRLLAVCHEVSGGALDWSSNRLLHDIGSYIMKVHIDRDYFVNFADASPRTIPDPVSVYHYGELFKDDTLQHFAGYLFSLMSRMPPDNSLTGFLETAVLYDALSSGTLNEGKPPYSFLPELQVFTARSGGLFVAMQGGNNGESHNHNDVGNFVLYAGGKPVIVDAGVGTYTAQTFSSRRYEIWTMQSQWHNCPLINGVMQSAGKSFRANDVRAGIRGHKVEISMDIAKAYPSGAGVKQWERKVVFDRSNGSMELADRYAIERRTGETRINFLTCERVTEEKKGEIVFLDGDGHRVLALQYPVQQMSWTVEEKVIDDEKLMKEWGNKLYRLSFLLHADLPLTGSAVFHLKQ